MMKVRMESTTEYERLVQFGIKQGLEYDEEGVRDYSDIVGAWKITQPGDFLIGCCMLAKEEGHFVIRAVAVDPVLRKMGIGRILIKKAMEKARELGGTEVILIGRAPEFYRRLGFEPVAPEDSPLEFECLECPQFQVNCFPEIMKKSIPAEGPVL
ncbi:MAG: GNAT family N-acetyltransferase [Firmicutes bacterium]|nr:GNAT family N-acetyltransferase [Bacillota bacterium]